MVRGKDSQLWWHTVAIVATIANVNRGKGQQPVKPASLHPYHGQSRASGMPVRSDTMSTFVALLVSPERAKAAEERQRQEQDRLAAMMAEQLARLT